MPKLGSISPICKFGSTSPICFNVEKCSLDLVMIKWQTVKVHKAKSCHQLFLLRLRRLIAVCVNSCAEIRRQRICQRFYYVWKKSNQKRYIAFIQKVCNLHWWCFTGLNFHFPHQLLLICNQVNNGNRESKKNRIWYIIYFSIQTLRIVWELAVHPPGVMTKTVVRNGKSQRRWIIANCR